MTTFTCGIAEASIYRVHDLDSDVSIQAPTEMGLLHHSMLQVMRTLYVIPESVLH